MTEYGKFIRAYRKEHGENLKSMSEKLNVSIAFLSAIEVGKKKIPIEYIGRICDVYHLTLKEYEELTRSVMETNKLVEIPLHSMNEEKKNLSLMFARKINGVNQKTLDELRKILEGEDNHEKGDSH